MDEIDAAFSRAMIRVKENLRRAGEYLAENFRVAIPRTTRNRKYGHVADGITVEEVESPYSGKGRTATELNDLIGDRMAVVVNIPHPYQFVEFGHLTGFPRKPNANRKERQKIATHYVPPKHVARDVFNACLPMIESIITQG